MELKHILDEIFEDRELMDQALTTSDYVNNNYPKDKHPGYRYQKGLDTLGDAVLDICIIQYFFKQGIIDPESLDKKRQSFGKNEFLKTFAKEHLQLQDTAFITDNEKNQLETQDSKVLATCFEAIVGALFIDKEFEGVEAFLKNIGFYQKINKITQ